MRNKQTAGKLAPPTSDEDLYYVFGMLKQLRAKAAEHDFTLAYLLEIAVAQAADILNGTTPSNPKAPPARPHVVKS